MGFTSLNHHIDLLWLYEAFQHTRHDGAPGVDGQHRTLSQKLRGHYAYYGITGNIRALACFRHAVSKLWRKWLSRRSWAARLSWDHYVRMLEQFPLPPPIVVHSVYRPQPAGDLRSRMR